jgi:hypothetical protein
VSRVVGVLLFVQHREILAAPEDLTEHVNTPCDKIRKGEVL